MLEKDKYRSCLMLNDCPFFSSMSFIKTSASSMIFDSRLLLPNPNSRNAPNVNVLCSFHKEPDELTIPEKNHKIKTLQHIKYMCTQPYFTVATKNNTISPSTLLAEFVLLKVHVQYLSSIFLPKHFINGVVICCLWRIIRGYALNRKLELLTVPVIIQCCHDL